MNAPNEQTQTERLTPKLRPLLRLQFDELRELTLLLMPERVVELNETAAEILKLCDGTHTVETIKEVLSQGYEGSDLSDDVQAFIEDAKANRWITMEAPSQSSAISQLS